MTPAPGASITLGDDDNFTLILGTYTPLEAPVAQKKSLGSTAVICPLVKAVDLYVTVDGEAQTGGHICCGDATLDRAASLQRAEDKVASSGEEEALRTMLKAGRRRQHLGRRSCPRSSARPSLSTSPLWSRATSTTPPCPSRKSTAAPSWPASRALLASVGEGAHEVTVRVRRAA